jgi:hypothetical protein
MCADKKYSQGFSCVELVGQYDMAERVLLVNCDIDHCSLNVRYMVVSIVAPVLVN